MTVSQVASLIIFALAALIIWLGIGLVIADAMHAKGLAHGAMVLLWPLPLYALWFAIVEWG